MGVGVKRTIWIGIIGGILLLLALLLNWVNNTAPVEQTSDTTPPAALETPAESTTPAPVITETPPASDEDSTTANAPSVTDSTAPAATETAPADTETPSDSGTDTDTAASAPATDQTATTPDAAPAPPIEPSFDVVRIEPNGDAVIAGRAEPRSQVTILDGGADLGAVEADGRGEWVYLPNSALEPGPHELKLKSLLPDGRTIFGGGTVVLVVPKPGQDIAGRETEDSAPQQPVVVLIPDESKPGAELIQRPSGSTPPAAEATTTPTPTPSTAPATSNTVTAEPEGVRSADGTLSVDTIDYDPAGNISIAGRGPLDTTVLAYLDNVLIGNSRVQDDKSWRIDPNQEVAPGVYNLRLDAMRNSSVIARLEIPFSRAAPLTDLQGDSFIVVQPGNSLWRIARRTLGDGFSYTVIYDANSDQIRDPDLIYPGQVFEIPGN